MSNVCVYSFADIDGLTQYIDDNDYNYTGTWSSSGTYVASTLDVVTYATALYICIDNNVGDNPRRTPTRTNPTNWSVLSLLYEYQCDGTTADTVGQAAYALAQSGTNIAWAAYALAQIGTNTGSAAYTLAGSAYTIGTDAYALAGSAATDAANALNTANGAFAIAVAGTTAANEALDILSTRLNGTVSVWAAGSFGGPTNTQLTFINGVLAVITP